jgi:membrane-associated protein
MLDPILDLLSASPWTYALVFTIAALDVLVPVLPSETAVITAGVMASTGELELGLVIAAAAFGAIAGDNAAYLVGRAFGSSLLERLVRTRTARERLAWAEGQIDERGGGLIVTARFIPGGRTAATIGAGALAMPWRRFIRFDVPAGLVWAAYAALIGAIGGRAFEDQPTLALLLAFGVALAGTTAIELVRSRRRLKR